MYSRCVVGMKLQTFGVKRKDRLRVRCKAGALRVEMKAWGNCTAAEGGDWRIKAEC
jgi:hypothetical protein